MYKFEYFIRETFSFNCIEESLVHNSGTWKNSGRKRRINQNNLGRTTGEVVGSILLTGDQLFRVEQLTVSTRADLVDHRRLQVDEDAPRHVLAGARLGEEGVERVITATDRLVARHLAVRLNTVLEAVELPAGVTDLETGLADVD